MARIGFLSHSDGSIYLFRLPIMRSLKDRGHEVFAIIPDNSQEYADLIKKEFQCVTYKIQRASLNPFKVCLDTYSLIKALRPLRLDLLQTSSHKSNTFGTFGAKIAGVRRVINLVEGLGSIYAYNDLKSRALQQMINALYLVAFKLSDACIFVNDSDPDYMAGMISKSKIKRIKSVGVDANVFNPATVEEEGQTPNSKKSIVMISRALLYKGIVEFYEAANLLSHRDDCEFVFIGDVDNGNLSSVNSQFLVNKNVKWIKWSNKIKEILKSTYVFVLPSYSEGFSRAVLEAMSMEVACVVTKVAGNTEAVINGVNGLICEPKNPADLAAKIEILLDDENLTKTMGKAGRQMVLDLYDQPIITKKYLEVYREFIDV